MVQRMTRALLLDWSVYREVAADRGAMGQTLFVVLLVAVATGIGAMDSGGLRVVPSWMVLAFVQWIVWASLAYLIGTKLLPVSKTNAGWGNLARAVGYAQLPGTIRILGVVPGIGLVASMAAIVWQLMALVFAVRQTLSYESSWRALAVVAIGLPIYLVVAIGLSFTLQLT